jgi:hypothetical protein
MNVPRAIFRLTAFAAGLFISLFFAKTAAAYPWMIRHGYTGCATCHTDPSGGAGALTAYGRAQSDLLLRMRYGQSSEEADKTSGFMWGTIPLPDELRLGGDFREAFFSDQPENAPLNQQLITMRADLYGDVKVGRFRATGSIGYAPTGALGASITDAPQENLISREHWVGAELDEDGAWLVRAGRITIPFGIRMVEHTLWVRSLTRTDMNDTQTYGAALAVTKDNWRGEVMGIAGNFMIHPDAFRERGGAGYFEYAPTTTLAVGVSALVTRATRDIVYGVTDYRQAYGPFVRYAPVQALVLMAEFDGVFQSLTWHGHRDGYAGFIQADYEPVQGFHFMLTSEAMNSGQSGEPSSFDGWVSAVWFFAPHADLRIDGIFTSAGIPSTAVSAASYQNDSSWLAQFHLFL